MVLSRHVVVSIPRARLRIQFRVDAGIEHGELARPLTRPRFGRRHRRTRCGLRSLSPSAVTAHFPLQPDEWVHDEARTDGNPLKGFTSYLWAEPANDMPDAMEFPPADVITWDASGETFQTPALSLFLRPQSHSPRSCGYLTPDKPSGVPAIYRRPSAAPLRRARRRLLPDYEHPDLKAAILDFIAALGERYDGDPRLGFVQVGLLGFWGEWHTWPHTEMFPSEAMQAEVLDAFVDEFAILTSRLRRARSRRRPPDWISTTPLLTARSGRSTGSLAGVDCSRCSGPLAEAHRRKAQARGSIHHI